MIGFIDKRIGNLLLRLLHNRRGKVIAQTIINYQASHQADAVTLAALKEKLEFEMTRVFAIVDESIVQERIQRARYTFWISAAIGTAFVLAFTVFPVTTSLVPFFAPLVSAFIAWAVAISTIPIGYNTRVKGAMDSTVLLFDLERAKKTSPEKPIKQEKVAALQNTISELQDEIRQMRRQISNIRRPALPASTASSASFWRTRINANTDPKVPQRSLSL